MGERVPGENHEMGTSRAGVHTSLQLPCQERGRGGGKSLNFSSGGPRLKAAR